MDMISASVISACDSFRTETVLCVNKGNWLCLSRRVAAISRTFLRGNVHGPCYWNFQISKMWNVGWVLGFNRFFTRHDVTSRSSIRWVVNKICLECFFLSRVSYIGISVSKCALYSKSLLWILTFCWPCISVYLSQYWTNLMHKICFTVIFIVCVYMFRAHVLIIRRSKFAIHSNHTRKIHT